MRKKDLMQYIEKVDRTDRKMLKAHNNNIKEDEQKLTKEISEAKDRLNKLKKILYRLKVCERILNNEEE